MKAAFKTVIRIACQLCVLPLALAFAAHAAVVQPDAAIKFWSQLLGLLPGGVGVYLRHAFFSWSLPRCGRDVHLGFATVLASAKTTFGDGVYVGNFCSLGHVEIDDDVLIASHVSVMNGCHQHKIERLDIPVREQPGDFPVVRIGRDSWIGERALVAADIGRHCVVGAGAVVLQPLPDYSIAVGVPARVIGDRRDVAAQNTRNDSTSDADMQATVQVPAASSSSR